MIHRTVIRHNAIHYADSTGKAMIVRYTCTESDIQDRDWVKPAHREIRPILEPAIMWTLVAVAVAAAIAFIGTYAAIVPLAAAAVHDISGVIEFAAYGEDRKKGKPDHRNMLPEFDAFEESNMPLIDD